MMVNRGIFFVMLMVAKTIKKLEKGRYFVMAKNNGNDGNIIVRIIASDGADAW